MSSKSLLLLFHILLFAVAQDGFFVNPPAPSDEGMGRDWENNPQWSVGSHQLIKWQWNEAYPYYRVYLFNIIDRNGSLDVNAGPVLYEKTERETQADNSFNWTVSPMGFDLTKSDAFFFQLIKNVSYRGDHYFHSHLFNITTKDIGESTTRSQTSPAPTGTSSTGAIPTTSDTNSSFASHSKDTLSLALGIGLGLGVPLVLLVGVLVGLKIVKARSAQAPSQATPEEPHQQHHDVKFEEAAPRYSYVARNTTPGAAELPSPEFSRLSELY